MRQSFSGDFRKRIDAAGKVARAGADANRAAAAEQRHRHGFVDQPRRLGRQFVAVKPHQRKRIVGVIDGGRHQRVGTLAHQAGVGTIEQDDRTAGIGPGEKGVDLFSAKRDQWSDQLPATKYDASRVWMFSAICCAARSSASRKARDRAKR